MTPRPCARPCVPVHGWRWWGQAGSGPSLPPRRPGGDARSQWLRQHRRRWPPRSGPRWGPRRRPGTRPAVLGCGWLPADEVVTAIGVRPAVDWLAGSGVALENGVAVDTRLRASVPGVYAAGDCAAFVSRRYGRRLRVEHWDSALHGPEVVAANILGGTEEYDPVPYFWSEQFGRMVQYAGHHDESARLVWRGDPQAREWSACWLAGPGSGQAGAGSEQAIPGSGRAIPGSGHAERLVAVLAIGRPRDLLQGRRLIASGDPVDDVRLSDPAIPVRDALVVQG